MDILGKVGALLPHTASPRLPELTLTLCGSEYSALRFGPWLWGVGLWVYWEEQRAGRESRTCR